ncbi:MAG: hypothetical protein AAFP02_08785, partial [Bacteroidota bacterium]
MRLWSRFWTFSERSNSPSNWERAGRSLALLFVVFLCQPVELANACGPFRYQFNGYSFINPDLLKKDNPYTEYFVQFDALYESHTAARELQETNNLTEWRGRFCDLVKLEDLRKVIYDSSQEDLELLRTSIKSPKLPLDYRMVGNSFARHLKQHQCTETIDYLVFAKECEPHVMSPDNPWDAAPQRDTQTMMDLIKRGRKQFMKTDSYYIRLRYAYQLVRLAHYAQAYEQALELYDFLMPKVDSQVKSLIRYWVLGHKAGALMKLGRNVEASYLFAKIF